jgi:PHP family Zn ribbon phosphoesterase
LKNQTERLRPYLADLHVHTVLSPCAEVEMIPPLIVKRASELALGIIAITDHNSAENVAAVIEAAESSDLTVLPGMEVHTREEVHLLCLFDSVQQALNWQEFVYAHLPPLRNNENLFGPQFVVDASGDLIRHNERLLAVT